MLLLPFHALTLIFLPRSSWESPPPTNSPDFRALDTHFLRIWPELCGPELSGSGPLLPVLYLQGFIRTTLNSNKTHGWDPQGCAETPPRRNSRPNQTDPQTRRGLDDVARSLRDATAQPPDAARSLCDATAPSPAPPRAARRSCAQTLIASAASYGVSA